MFAKRSANDLVPYRSIDIVVLRGRGRAISGQENHTNLPLLNRPLGNLLHVLPLLDRKHISLRVGEVLTNNGSHSAQVSLWRDCDRLNQELVAASSIRWRIFSHCLKEDCGFLEAEVPWSFMLMLPTLHLNLAADFNAS